MNKCMRFVTVSLIIGILEASSAYAQNVQQPVPAASTQGMQSASTQSAQSIQHSLIKKAFLGKIDELKELVAKGAVVNKPDYLGEFAITHVGSVENAKYLLENGADINKAGHKVPFIWVMMQHSDEAAKYLLENGANINAQEDCGNGQPTTVCKDRTALMWFADSGDLEHVKLLLERGADVNISSTNEGTALDFAENYMKRLEQASQHGENVEADKKNQSEIIRLLEEKGAHDTPSSEQVTPPSKNSLVAAARSGDLALLKKLVDSGANINQQTPDDANEPDPFARGMTALMWAADKGDTAMDMAKYLVKKGANVNIQDPFGRTALMHAIGHMPRRGSDMTKYLLDNGANINIRDKNGMTALATAEAWGDIEMFKYLLSRGADINIKDNKGDTVLMVAKRNNDDRIIQLLH